MFDLLAAVTPSATPSPPVPAPSAISLTSTPIPVPTSVVRLVNEATGPDFQPLWVAVVGVVGLSIAAWIAARSALRQRLIDVARADFDKRSEFHVRAIAAINEIGITSALVIHYYHATFTAALAAMRQGPRPPLGGESHLQIPIDPALGARVETATAAWRTTLAESHLYTGGTLSDAIGEFDVQRAVAIEAINAMDGTPESLTLAEAELSTLTDFNTRRLYLLLQVEKVRGSGTLAHIARRWFPRRYAVEWQQEIERQIEQAHTILEGLKTPAPASPPTMPSDPAAGTIASTLPAPHQPLPKNGDNDEQ